jgi:hypothetical protein
LGCGPAPSTSRPTHSVRKMESIIYFFYSSNLLHPPPPPHTLLGPFWAWKVGPAKVDAEAGSGVCAHHRGA